MDSPLDAAGAAALAVALPQRPMLQQLRCAASQGARALPTWAPSGEPRSLTRATDRGVAFPDGRRLTNTSLEPIPLAVLVPGLVRMPVLQELEYVESSRKMAGWTRG